VIEAVVCLRAAPRVVVVVAVAVTVCLIEAVVCLCAAPRVLVVEAGVSD